ncbi:MAG: lipopolysaccharide biosynthesis protein, partial [Alistipes sp.]|nr:lipopolysaccharide biosynthesis protein [Alistipes sp.]
MIWNAVQRFGSIGIYFLANIILVRLIDPEVFGSIGILLIFVSISTSIVDGGFSSALIQQKNIKQVDYSTVFYWSIVASLVMMCIIWLVSPIVAEYYNTPILNKVLRVQSVLFLFHALGVVQNAKLTKELSFRTLATRNIIASASGAVIAVVMAYNGYGIWSIVAQELVMAIVGTTLLWISCKWIPTLEFSRSSFLRMFKFGSYVFLSTIIDTLYRNVQSLIIGRRFSMMELGYYTQARKLENVPIDSASSVVASVLFPALS